MRRINRRLPGIERLSEDQLTLQRATTIHRHIEVTGEDSRGRINPVTVRHAVPVEQVEPAPSIESAASTLFPGWLDDDFVQKVFDLQLEEEDPGRKRSITSVCCGSVTFLSPLTCIC